MTPTISIHNHDREKETDSESLPQDLLVPRVNPWHLPLVPSLVTLAAVPLSAFLCLLGVDDPIFFLIIRAGVTSDHPVHLGALSCLLHSPVYYLTETFIGLFWQRSCLDHFYNLIY